MTRNTTSLASDAIQNALVEAAHRQCFGAAAGHAAASTHDGEDGCPTVFRPLNIRSPTVCRGVAPSAPALTRPGSLARGLTCACYSQDTMRLHLSAPRHPSRGPAQREWLGDALQRQRACLRCNLRGAAPMSARWAPVKHPYRARVPACLHPGDSSPGEGSSSPEPRRIGLAPSRRSGTSRTPSP